MTFKTIVAVIQGEKDEDRLLDCVLPLANHFKSHVIGVHAEPMPVAYTTPMGFPDAEFIHISSERNEKRAAELGQRYSARCLAEGISGEWRSLESFSGDSALSSLASARCADLIVAVQSNPDGDSISSANLEGLLFEAGRPVLFVPYAASVTGTFRKVLIAWNGSREAARAVFDALPFIMDADEIEILVVDAEDDEEQDATVAGGRYRRQSRPPWRPRHSCQREVGGTVDRYGHREPRRRSQAGHDRDGRLQSFLAAGVPVRRRHPHASALDAGTDLYVALNGAFCSQTESFWRSHKCG